MYAKYQRKNRPPDYSAPIDKVKLFITIKFVLNYLPDKDCSNTSLARLILKMTFLQI